MAASYEYIRWRDALKAVVRRVYDMQRPCGCCMGDDEYDDLVKDVNEIARTVGLTIKVTPASRVNRRYEDAYEVVDE